MTLYYATCSVSFRTLLRRLIMMAACVSIVVCVGASHAAEAEIYSALSARNYQDVFDDVHFAIAEHNFRITGGNTIGNAIKDRLGEPFPRSDVVHFCNLEFARRLLEIDATWLNHMPCKVVVYQQGHKVTVESRLLDETHPQAGKIAAEVNVILRAIVDYAATE